MFRPGRASERFRPPHTTRGSRRVRGGVAVAVAVLVWLATALAVASAQGDVGEADAATPARVERISVPDFAMRGDVGTALRDSFMNALRASVARRTRLEVPTGDLITPGVAGSLERELTLLIADLDNARYAMSGELRSDPATDGVLVSALLVDRDEGRASDVIAVPIRTDDVMSGAEALAEQVASFVAGLGSLPSGTATLWISSSPIGAIVSVDGARVGTTGDLDLLSLAPGRYQIEVRKEGYVPEIRSLELGPNDARLLTLALTPVSGGSLQVITTPEATVVLDGEAQGTAPLSLAVVPGSYELRLERAGFEPLIVTVPVRSLRVTRIDEVLEPIRAPTVVWSMRPGLIVEIDGLPWLEGFAGGVGPGPVEIYVREGDRTVRRTARVPDGARILRLDLETGDLTPIDDD